MSDTILVINAGSSSIKFYLYDIDGKEELAPRLGGQLEGIGTSHPRLRVRDTPGQTLVERDIAPATRPCPMARRSWAPGSAATWAARRWPWAIAWCTAAPSCPEPVLIDDDILARLDAYTPLAPLHQPNNLAPIRVIRERRPGFPGRLLRHRLPSQPFRGGRPLRPARIAVPAGRAALRLPWPVLRVHRPAPAARCPSRWARSSPPTWARACRPAPSTRARAWTAPWASPRWRACPWARGRAGWTGVVLWMMERGMSHDEIEHLLYHDCGMKGLSGIGNDMRELLASDAPGAKLACPTSPGAWPRAWPAWVAP